MNSPTDPTAAADRRRRLAAERQARRRARQEAALATAEARAAEFEAIAARMRPHAELGRHVGDLLAAGGLRAWLIARLIGK